MRHSADNTRKVELGFSNADVKLTLADVQAYFELHNINNIEIVSGAAQPQVCSSSFIRLGEFQQTILLARVDSSGWRFCNDVVVVGRAAAPIWQSSVDGAEVDDLQQLIRRPEGATSPYLVVPSGISDYAGANCLAFIPRVYDLTREGLVEVTSQFPLFYKTQSISWRSNNPAPTDAALCTAMELEKLKRLLGSDPRAGFDTAVNWMVVLAPTLGGRRLEFLAILGIGLRSGSCRYLPGIETRWRPTARRVC
jgi:hypothetical protein